MADKITRTFWIVPGQVDKDGQPVEHPTRPGTGIAGTGILGATPLEVTETMTEDGEYVQTVKNADGSTQEIARGVDKARLDLYKSRREDAPKPEDPNKAPQTIKTDDGRTLQWDSAKKGWMEIAPAALPAPAKQAAPTVVAAAAADETEEWIVQQMPSGAVRKVKNPRYNPEAAARKAAAEKRALTSADIRDEAARLDMLVKERKMTDDQRDRQFDEWYKGRVLEHQERQAELANRREDRLATSSERQFERQATQDERRAKLDEETLGFSRTKAAYDVGQDTVRNAMALLPYRVGSGFARNFAEGVNTLSRGGGPVNFAAEDFMFKAPDLEAMREQSMARALSAFQGSTPPAFQPGVAPSGADLMAPPPSPLVGTPAPPVGPYIPPQRRQMPY